MLISGTIDKVDNSYRIRPPQAKRFVLILLSGGIVLAMIFFIFILNLVNDFGLRLDWGLVVFLLFWTGVIIYLLFLLMWNLFGSEILVVKNGTAQYYADYYFFKIRFKKIKGNNFHISWQEYQYDKKLCFLFIDNCGTDRITSIIPVAKVLVEKEMEK